MSEVTKNSLHPSYLGEYLLFNEFCIVLVE